MFSLFWVLISKSKDGKTQFHRMVYSAAKDLDETFADEIQTCIVK